MKKFLVLMLALIMSIPAMTLEAQNKELQKQLKKEYKNKMKQFKKEKWTMFGSSRSLEVALLKHYEALNEDGTFEIVGVVSKSKSKNIAQQVALNNACNLYARQAGSTVKGRIVSDMATDQVDPEAEFDHFYGAYESLVEKEIKGEMQRSFSIIRDNGDGTFEMQTYFVINEAAATQARIRAFENAAKESAAAQKYAKKVSEFIKEGFEVSAE